MKEYIERDSAAAFAYNCGAVYVSNRLSNKNAFPAADVAPVRHGKNLDAEWPSLFTCSACGWSDGDTTTGDTISYNYCPNCGAKMDLDLVYPG